MEKQASALMKEEVFASVRLECPQLIRDMVSGSVSDYYASSGGAGVEQAIGGAAGSLFGLLVTGSTQKSSLGGGGVYYVAVGPTKIAFFSIKQGLIKGSVDKLLAEYPRSELKNLEIKKGYMSKVHFVFTDGTSLALQCSRMMRGKLKKVEQILTAL